MLYVLQSHGMAIVRPAWWYAACELGPQEGPAPIEQTQTASFLSRGWTTHQLLLEQWAIRVLATMRLEEATIQPNPIAESLRGDAWQHMIPRTGPSLSASVALWSPCPLCAKEHVATFWPPGASPRPFAMAVDGTRDSLRPQAPLLCIGGWRCALRRQ